MWGSAFYLLVGNYLIAILETAALKRLFRGDVRLFRWQVVHPDSESLLRYSREQRGYSVLASPWLVLSNYASAFVGAHMLGRADPLREMVLGDRPLEMAATYVVLLWVLSFMLSLLIELPFFARATRLKPLSKENLSLLLKVHLISYAVISGWFWWVSSKSFFFKVDVVAANEIKSATPGWVYYIDESGRIRRVRINGSVDELVADRSALPPGLLDYTFLSAEPGKDGRARLLAVSELYGQEPAIIASNLAGNAQVTEPIKGHDGEYRYETFGYHTGRTFKPGDPAAPRYRTGFWAYEGVSITRDDRHFNFALETPFLSWNCRSAYTLPSGHGIVQFGPQIVLIDPEEKKVAFLARGRGPTLVIDQNP